ncbi:MAG: hypothetical protein EAS52_03050 [Parapedobacter sp.]|nr:MAG: hypothetical protein EAS52_03050 [Parapedobacter sp.]
MKEDSMVKFSKRQVNGLEVLSGENNDIRFEMVPALGGKLTSVFNKKLQKEFLWHNRGLALAENSAGDDYDSNFWGGIDELLPNDIPEIVDGIDYPDHGELWTTRLEYTLADDHVSVFGQLPKSNLFYAKTVSLLEGSGIKLEYQIVNRAERRRHFLWKFHAALHIEPGDRLESPAIKARVVYPQSSRFGNQDEFNWPMIEGMDAALVPAKDNTMDFFYLYDLPESHMSLVSDEGNHRFTYRYDGAIFPYQWYFASYGQFRNHYTAILEPASAMPVSVNEAAALGQCSMLEPGEALHTVVTIHAGATNEINKRK